MANGSETSTEKSQEEVEALGAAIAEASEQASEAGKKKGRSRRSSRKKLPIGEWTGIDGMLTLVLLANVALMAVFLLVDTGKKEPDPSKGPSTGTQAGTSGLDIDPKGQKPVASPKRGKLPIVPKHELWDHALALAAEGNLPEAISALEKMLEDKEEVAGVVRRTVFQQLAYYHGMSGNPERARHFQILASKGHVRGMTPKDLWKLAEEATALGDHREARRYAARFLLQRSRFTDASKGLVPLAYMRLADGFRDEAKQGLERSRSKAADDPKPKDSEKSK